LKYELMSMNQDRNPQAEQMADESMARNLAFQAEVIWPQELPLFKAYSLGVAPRILDVGCGTGEITRRLAILYPQARITGIDILDSNLAIARRENQPDPARVDYAVGDAFALTMADDSVDLLVCRHVSQAVPNFTAVLKEFRRVLKPGGVLHLLSEDYGMLHFPDAGMDPDRFWNKHAVAYMQSINCDARIGRHSPKLLLEAGFEQITMNYLTVDTLRVPRASFAGILSAWRDGYAEVLAKTSGRTVTAVTDDFNIMIQAIETPPNYAVWHVPVLSARKP
jgi:ubiquinone/menaquinone biosynthesis C-methylase UbiE